MITMHLKIYRSRIFCFIMGMCPGSFGTSLSFRTMTVLMGNPPTISSVSALSSGRQKIGSTINLLLTANESGYFFMDSSTINNIPFSSSNISKSEVGIGNYNIGYTVFEGNQNVTAGNLAIRIILSDSAGNISNPWTLLGPNDISIDAVRPSISRAYISSTDESINVGEKIDITVIADQSGYSVSPLTWINGIRRHQNECKIL